MWRAHLAVDQTFRLWRFNSVSIHGQCLRKPLLRSGEGGQPRMIRVAVSSVARSPVS